MKKQYEAPVAEKIEFCYRDQVVASGVCDHTNTKEYYEDQVCTSETTTTSEAS